MTSSEPTFNKNKLGDIPNLTHTNYDEWRDDMIPVLSAMRAYAIVTGDDPEPQLLDLDHNDKYDDWKAKEAKPTSIITLSCSTKVRRIVKGIRNPDKMWNVLETSLDTAGSYIGTEDILRQFCACRPQEDEPLKSYFTNLNNYHIQLDLTDDTNTDCDFHMQILTSLPSQYAMILMLLKYRRPLPTPEEAMHDLLEEETTASLTKELGDSSIGTALLYQHSRFHGSDRGRSRGRRERSGRSGHGGTEDSHESKCTYWKMDSHTTDACRKHKRAQEGGNNDQRICFQCALPGHVKVNSVSYKCIKK